MSRATPAHLLRALLFLVVVSTQLLSPLMHGHLGTPKQHGLHVHASLAGAVHSHCQSCTSDATPHSTLKNEPHAYHGVLLDNEPFEVDVEPGTDPSELPTVGKVAADAGLSVTTFVLLVVLATSTLAAPVFEPPPRKRSRRDQRVNRPPPSQAPPVTA